MNPEPRVVTAIKGALNQFEGFGDYIVSSHSFSVSQADVAAISDIDRELQTFYNNYPESYHAFAQHYLFPSLVANVPSFLLIRAKKKHIQFPDRNRYYDQREFYYYKLTQNINPAALLQAIPQKMREYAAKQIGQAPDIDIRPGRLQPDTPLLFQLVSGFLAQQELRLIITPENSEKINFKLLSAISVLPQVYFKYLGFGFNISSDAFASKYLVAYTTLEEGATEITTTQKDKLRDAFINALLAERLEYTDAEILPARLSNGKTQFFQLLAFHWLHFRIDLYLSGDYAPDSDQLLEDSNKYAWQFANAEHSVDPYLAGRIAKCYCYWSRSERLTEAQFIKFWSVAGKNKVLAKELYQTKEITDSISSFKSVLLSRLKAYSDTDQVPSVYLGLQDIEYPDLNISDAIKLWFIQQHPKLRPEEINQVKAFRIKMLEQYKINIDLGFLSLVDFAGLDAVASLKLVLEERKSLSSDQLRMLVSQVPLDGFYTAINDKQHAEIAAVPLISERITALLSIAGTTVIKQWSELYVRKGLPALRLTGFFRHHHLQNGEGAITFDAMADTLQLLKIDFPKNEVQDYVQGALKKKGSLYFERLGKALKICEKYQFTIRVEAPSKADNRLINDYVMLTNYKNCISNPEVLDVYKHTVTEFILSRERPLNAVLEIKDQQRVWFYSNSSFLMELLIGAFKESPAVKNWENLSLLVEDFIYCGKNDVLQLNNDLYLLIASKELSWNKETLKTLNDWEQQLLHQANEQLSPVVELLRDIKVQQQSNEESIAGDLSLKIKKWISGNSYLTAGLLVACLFSLWGNSFLIVRNTALKDSLSTRTTQTDSLKNKYENQMMEFRATIDSIKAADYASTPDLKPEAKFELSGNGRRVVNNSLKGVSISEIVDRIFKNNPGDAGNPYGAQKKSYIKLLDRANPNFFGPDGKCVFDTLFHIPAANGNKPFSALP
jgi:hypothetical protein